MQENHIKSQKIALDENHDDKTKLLFRKHSRYNYKFRPHRIDDNWVHAYYIPWVCFLEIAIMAFYILFGYLYQRTTLDFATDYSKAVNDYFISGYDFPIDDNTNIEDKVNIFFKSKFFKVINGTGYRFLNFENVFPCSNSFSSDGFIRVKIDYKKTRSQYIFGLSNISQLQPLVESFSSKFDKISITSVFHIKPENELSSVDITIAADFENDHDTKIITLFIHHSLIPHIDQYRWNSFLKNPLITIPIIIIIFSIICIILELRYSRSVYVYSHFKASNNFLKPFEVFKKKFDKWTIYSIFCHILSIVACFISIFDRSDYTSSVPVIMIFLALATFFHCFLLIRYFKAKSYTMVVVKVIAGAAVKIGQFLIGCIAIFLAYLLLGCSFFGPYNPTFRTFIDGAECLIAIVHGDSIQSMFDSSSKRPTINEWYGIIYLFVWIFFSLTIMFNISISIFQEVLLSEMTHHDKEKLKIKRGRDVINDQYTFILPLNMKRNV